MPPATAATREAPKTGAVFRFAAIGTAWQIDTEHPLTGRLRDQIIALTEDFDRVWSRFRADSLVTEIAHTPGRCPLHTTGWFHRPSTTSAQTETHVRPR